MISKIIWQTHEYKYEDLPTHMLNISNTWKNLNPGWDYRYEDAEQRLATVKAFDQTLYEYYIHKDTAKVTQADIWRYVVTYQHGGVYADLDSICNKPLDDLIENIYYRQDMVCTQSMIMKDGSNTVWLNNSNFATTKNSEIMKMILDRISYGFILYKNNPSIPFNIKEYGPWNSFNTVVLEYASTGRISFMFDAAIHSDWYKKKFSDKFNVNLKDSKKSYSELCKINNWKIF